MSGKIEISRELARLLYQDTMSCWGVGGNAANQLNAILTAPVIARQEPVAWIKPKTLEELTPSGMVYVTGFDLGDSIPLYTSPPAPVAVVLPERREPTQESPYLTDADHEWNACLDKVKELNQ
jgi:hypothetical protein